jgi:hypothetical protein
MHGTCPAHLIFLYLMMMMMMMMMIIIFIEECELWRSSLPNVPKFPLFILLSVQTFSSALCLYTLYLRSSLWVKDIDIWLMLCAKITEHLVWRL